MDCVIHFAASGFVVGVLPVETAIDGQDAAITDETTGADGHVTIIEDVFLVHHPWELVGNGFHSVSNPPILLCNSARKLYAVHLPSH